MEVKVLIENIENLKTTTGLKVAKDKDEELTESRLVTKFQFECEADPVSLSQIHRLLASEATVNIFIGSYQSLMPLVEQEEPVFPLL